MKQHFSLRASVCLALASMASSSVLAAGFQVNEHSANGLGRAMAGQAAKPENASILATNPAAIGVFKEAEFSASVSFSSRFLLRFTYQRQFFCWCRCFHHLWPPF